MSLDKKIANSVNQDAPIRLIFEEDIKPERIAEFIELLSNLYGEDLGVVLANTLPPAAGEIRKAA